MVCVQVWPVFDLSFEVLRGEGQEPDVTTRTGGAAGSGAADGHTVLPVDQTDGRPAQVRPGLSPRVAQIFVNNKNGSAVLATGYVCEYVNIALFSRTTTRTSGGRHTSSVRLCSVCVNVLRLYFNTLCVNSQIQP